MKTLTIVIAADYGQARQYAQRSGFRNGEWLFPLKPEDMKDVATRHVVYLDGWEKRKEADALQAAANAAVERANDRP